MNEIKYKLEILKFRSVQGKKYLDYLLIFVVAIVYIFKHFSLSVTVNFLLIVLFQQLLLCAKKYSVVNCDVFLLVDTEQHIRGVCA